MKMHVTLTKTSLAMIMMQFYSSPYTMSKKSGKKKAKATKGDSDMEIISRMEIVYEDTKAITGANQEFKRG